MYVCVCVRVFRDDSTVRLQFDVTSPLLYLRILKIRVHFHVFIGLRCMVGESGFTTVLNIYTQHIDQRRQPIICQHVLKTFVTHLRLH